ncbi:MAG: hypothetical protein JNK14_05855, partial [Chitinophagaceae bacterium]|nr:hypothetical protein [Chitinophagaceae bacterium]
MKKILFILLLIPFIVDAQFSESVYQPLGGKKTSIRVMGGIGIDSFFRVPAFETTFLPSGLSRAGYIILDSTGGNYGLHYYINGGFRRLVDTTMSATVAAENGVTFSGGKVRMQGSLI